MEFIEESGDIDPKAFKEIASKSVSIRGKIVKSHIDEHGDTIITDFELISASPIYLANHLPSTNLELKLSGEQKEQLMNELKSNNGTIKPYDEWPKPNRKYTEEEMRMALGYAHINAQFDDSALTIEQIDKMLNELGTNE